MFRLDWDRVLAKDRIKRMLKREAGGDESVIPQVCVLMGVGVGVNWNSPTVAKSSCTTPPHP
mgnify:FL=1